MSDPPVLRQAGPLAAIIFGMSLFKNPILIICLFFLNAKGQTTQYKLLLDTAIKSKGQLFVYSKPIIKIRLDKKDIRENYDDLKEIWKNVDTTELFQIIENIKNIDTTSWTDNELSESILIQDREKDVQLKYAIQKFNLSDKKKLKYYRNQINYFNSLSPADKNIYYYSRPIFDNSKQFAIVQWDNGHSGLGGGGGIAIYKLTGNTWKDLGIITRWQY